MARFDVMDTVALLDFRVTTKHARLLADSSCTTKKAHDHSTAPCYAVHDVSSQHRVGSEVAALLAATKNKRSEHRAGSAASPRSAPHAMGLFGWRSGGLVW